MSLCKGPDARPTLVDQGGFSEPDLGVWVRSLFPYNVQNLFKKVISAEGF
jgi:hypothetical protein